LSDAEEKCDEKAIKKQKEKLEQEYKSIKEASSEDSSFLNGEISPLDLEEEKKRIKNSGDPTPEPDSDSESEPTKEPTPEPTKVVTEEPTPEPTKEEVTPEPTKEEIQETEIKEVKLSAKDIKAYRSLNCFEGFRMPLSNKRKINERELWGLSEYECKIRYNELYARYGYQFAEKGEMKKHFDSLQWYKDIIKYQKISSDEEAKSQFSDVELYNWQIMYDYRGEKEKDESKKYPHKNDPSWPHTIRTVEFLMDDPDGPNGSGSATVYLEYTGVNCGYLTIFNQYVNYDDPITYWFEEDEELNGTVYSIDEYGSSPKGSRVKRISYKILPGDDPYVNFRVFSMEMKYYDETMSLGDFRWMEAIR